MGIGPGNSLAPEQDITDPDRHSYRASPGHNELNNIRRIEWHIDLTNWIPAALLMIVVYMIVDIIGLEWIYFLVVQHLGIFQIWFTLEENKYNPVERVKTMYM